MSVNELRQQLAGLHAQLQHVETERSALNSRLQTSQAEVQSLQQLRSWYQQQLAIAQEARVRLQNQMANMQVHFNTHVHTRSCLILLSLHTRYIVALHRSSSSQAGHMTQTGVLENLKIENVSLSHQLNETKHRSIKEKERIAVQLQSIEVGRAVYSVTSQPVLLHSSALNPFHTELHLQKKCVQTLFRNPNFYSQNLCPLSSSNHDH